MRAFVAGLLVIGLAGVAGCGGGDSTGPSNSSMDGTWHMSITNLSANGVTCSASDIEMDIHANGSTFTGTYGGVLACGPTDGQPEGTPVAGTIVHGTRNGTQVAFDLDNTDAHHAGTITGDNMNGTATYRINYLGGLVVATGSWAATR
jgi:hypothetical protein